MALSSIAKRKSLKLLKGHRQPDFGTIAASNRQHDSEHIPILQRQTIITAGQSHCRWPIGDPQKSGFYLCGAKTGAEKSYCPHHMQIAYQI